ncbi:DUF1194 domain-containing protein [Defluviimonas sp. WL0002]|uniref:DUF1194 domain-containing protein n=1 Tax=Albidovulum marisflavi TaxID=2984159 RepID=A0ABT2ZAL2_9RHOB|nr:DUF1194 domain-containing protein [Defluviimonas sp. WL0002]MCV2868190.1 DUF1194 domain-containing protein [Defluviimonas sp. WL0002]
MKALALALAFGFPATQAAAAECRLALALGLDVSSSVDPQEYALQRDGLAAALLSQQVKEALFSGDPRWVAIAVYEWSGRWQQAMVLDWTPIRNDMDLTLAAERIASAQRSYQDYPTALGAALGFGSTLLDRGPACDRRTLDISGDGVNNEAFAPSDAYRAFPFGDTLVNGLVITGSDPNVAQFYMSHVLRGPGAFLEQAGDYRDYEEAMARKLRREIGFAIIGAAAQPDGEEG